MKKMVGIVLAVMLVLSMGGLCEAYDFDTRHVDENFSLKDFQKDYFIQISGKLFYKFEEATDDQEHEQEINSMGWRIGNYIVCSSHTIWLKTAYVPLPFNMLSVPIVPQRIEIRARSLNSRWYDLKLRSTNESRDVAVFDLPKELQTIKKIPLGKLSKIKIGDFVYGFGGCLRAYKEHFPADAYTWKFGRVANITVYKGHQEILVNCVVQSGDSSGLFIAFEKGKSEAIGLAQITIEKTGIAGIVPIDYYIEEVRKLEQ